MYTKAIEDIIKLLTQLPGVGKRSAERMALFIMADEAYARQLGSAVGAAWQRIRRCKVCNNFSEGEICEICSKPSRRKDVICVVEGPKDVVAVESCSRYDGIYHVLMGVLSPLDNIGPSELHIADLVRRVKEEGITEVVIATGASAEGEATAYYIREQIRAFPHLKVTRIARGVPVGLDLEYVDKSSLAKALDNRTIFK